MKYHIGLKFIAIVLCAAALLAAAASGVAILVLAETDLYANTPQQLQQNRAAIYASGIAQDIANRYATMQLGAGNIVDHGYFGHPELECAGYIICNAQNKILESSADQMPADPLRFEVESRYLVETDAEAGWYYEYFDEAAQQWSSTYLTYNNGPVYTVYVVPNDVYDSALESQLLELMWQNRNALPWVLAGSLAVFAIAAVYLCCAAGRAPGSDEIRPGGLNLLPLDFYGGAFGMCLLLFTVAAKESRYLDLRAWEIVLGFAGYGCCLVFVGLCFACAAQFKMPKAYWFRHSITGWAVLLALRIAGWILPLAWRIVKAVWLLAIRILKAVWLWAVRFLRKCIQLFVRFWSMLPNTWQWIVAGGGIMLCTVIAVAYRFRDTFFCLVLLGGCVGAILWGAYAFGILMDTAKKLRQGDLSAKAESKWLIGSFREFGWHLNALSDTVAVAVDRQMRSERMRTELITNVSHDIKTPLTSIINYVDLLQHAQSPEQSEQYLQVLDRQSQRLKKLIEDLMEMSKASTGNMVVSIAPVDMREAIHQAVGEFSDKLAGARLEPVLRMPDCAVCAMADGKLLWRVMSNLIGNVVKYAQPGTRLYIDLEAGNGTVQVSMKNVSRDALNITADELMERFVRGDASRNTEGSGLGLNIAKSLMELQKGTLTLTVDGDLFKATLSLPSA